MLNHYIVGLVFPISIEVTAQDLDCPHMIVQCRYYKVLTVSFRHPRIARSKPV